MDRTSIGPKKFRWGQLFLAAASARWPYTSGYLLLFAFVWVWDLTAKSEVSLANWYGVKVQRNVTLSPKQNNSSPEL
jgi:hypothetical protein